jgi:P27 family predicted phage terminase small subunit
MRGTKPNLRTETRALSSHPKPPAWLGMAARREWQRVIPILCERRILTEADLGCLQSYCVAIGRIEECEATLRAEGMFFTGENGVPRPHPAIRVSDSAMTQARQIAAEMGLTPVSRSRPAMEQEPPEEDELGALVA